MATSTTRILLMSVTALYTAVPFFVHAAPVDVNCQGLISVQAFAPLTERLSPAQAAELSHRLVSQLRRAGQAVQAKNLSLAVQILDDPHLLDGTGFHLRTERPLLSTDVQAVTEREYHRHLLLNMTPKPGVKVDGGLVLPHVPNPEHRWANRSFIRIAAEELAHLAQKLDERARPDGGAVSQMFTGDGKATFEYFRITEKAVNDQLRALGLPLTSLAGEMDVYAFLIEIFGPEFIPRWFGEDSGHSLRIQVDQTLTKRGIPDRTWGN